MGNRVSYRCAESVARITMDDGRVNVLSLPMQAELHEALDQAEKDEAVVIMTGRMGVFSGGFDLGVLRAGGEDALRMLKGGFELAERLLSFPFPVVIACSGHAIAMALFVVLSGDYRIGVTGDARLTANEVAIGLTLPRAAIEVCRQRLAPAAFTRVALLAEPFSGQRAVEAGLLDEVVDAADLEARGARSGHGIARASHAGPHEQQAPCAPTGSRGPQSGYRAGRCGSARPELTFVSQPRRERKQAHAGSKTCLEISVTVRHRPFPSNPTALEGCVGVGVVAVSPGHHLCVLYRRLVSFSHQRGCTRDAHPVLDVVWIVDEYRCPGRSVGLAQRRPSRPLGRSTLSRRRSQPPRREKSRLDWR